MIKFYCDRCCQELDPCESVLALHFGFIEGKDFKDMDKTLDDVMFGWQTSILCRTCKQELQRFLNGAEVVSEYPVI